MCFVHVLRNLEKKIASYVKKEQRKEIKDDIKFLENLAEKDAFDAALELFEIKWDLKFHSF